MLDEDTTISVLEGLADRHPQAVVPLTGAVLIRPRPDRIVVVGAVPLAAAEAAQVAGTLPADPPWWLSLTTWGRLEMYGDIAAAAAWINLQARLSGCW